VARIRVCAARSHLCLVTAIFSSLMASPFVMCLSPIIAHMFYYRLQGFVIFFIEIDIYGRAIVE